MVALVGACLAHADELSPGDPTKYLPVDLNCSKSPVGLTELLTMNANGKQIRVRLGHGDGGRISFSVKEMRGKEFVETIGLRVQDVPRVEDAKLQEAANYLINQVCE